MNTDKDMSNTKATGNICEFLRILIGIVFFAFLLTFVLPVLGGVFNIGNILGMIFCGIMLFVTWGGKSFSRLVKCMKQKKLGKIVVKFVSVIFVLGVVYVGFLTGLIIKANNTKPMNDCTVIVLGCQVRGDHPSLMLKQRIDAAYAYLSQNPDVPCIVTGGQGEDENISEAQCMYDYLVDMGIEPDRIYMEDKATNTVENINFSKEIIEKNNFSRNTAIVTDIFHQYRASNIVKEAELTYGSVPADCSWYLVPTFYVRELVAITATFVGLA